MTIKLTSYGLLVQILFLGVMYAHNGSAQNTSSREIFIAKAINGFTVKEAFDLIESHSDFKMMYVQKDLNQKVLISLTPKSNRSIYDILLEISKQSNLKFRQVNNTISVSRILGPELENTLVRVDIVDTIDISGKITDENGSGLPGASIVEKGTSNGAISDLDGNYNLKVVEGATLTISFVGYVIKEVNIGSESVINVQMDPDAEQLEEVIIVGYGTQKKSDLTGSVASYQLNENDGRQFTSAASLLQGRMSGVVVSNNSFQPGAAASVKIRGGNSLRGDNEPLYVVDNVPLTSATVDAGDAFQVAGSRSSAQSALASINPNDIERIEVLKDASATAIYGSRGANGVILITTKKGKAGDTKVSFESSITIANISKKFDLLGLEDYVNLQNDVSGIGNEKYVTADQIPGASGSKWFYIPDLGSFDPSNSETYHGITAVDWQDELFQPAIQENYRLNFSGGSKNVNYFIAGGYQNTSGVTSGTGLQQGDFRLNLNAKASEKLNIGFNINGVLRNNDQQQNGNNFGASTSGSALRAALAGRPYSLVKGSPDNNGLFEEEGITDVFAWIEDHDDEATEYAFRSGLNLQYDIWNGISYELRAGGNYRWKERSRWFGKRTFRGAQENGALAVSTLTAYTYTIENLIKYNKQISDNFTLNALAGYAIDNQIILNEFKNGSGFDVDVLRGNGIHLANNTNVLQPNQGDFRISSYLGRLNAELFGGKYLITASIRADGSSKFPNNKWGIFPSTAIAWKINEETFLEKSDIVNQLKLRAGWGITGNQGIPAFSTLANYESGSQAYFDENGNLLVALQVNNLANSNLTWETTQSTNVGVDFAILDARISGSLDVYYKKTKDLLNQKSLAASAGFSTILVNQGSLENKGIELSLSTVIFEQGDWSVSLGGNISFNKAKVIDLGLEPAEFGNETFAAFTGNMITQAAVLPYPANIFAEGHEPALFWGLKTDGILQESDASLTYTPTVGINAPGEIKYIDTNGDGVIDLNDRTIIGNPNPDYTYGFQTDIKYKGISLRAFFNGVKGNDLINAGSYFLDYAAAEGASRNSLKVAYTNAWRLENPSNDYPKINANAAEVLNDRYVEDASYLRLAEVTLAYQVTNSIIERIKLSNLNIFMSGRNLFTITDYKGYDPAANSFAFDGLRQGIDFNAFPNVRSYTIGLKATF